MRSTRQAFLTALAATVALAACGDAREVGGDEQEGCASCHGFPPPPGVAGPAATHPQNDQCFVCHGETVDAENELIAGGAHLNGQVDVSGGHAAGYGAPGVHGPDANAAIVSCQACHGTDYAGGTSGASCNTCHGGAGFADWRTNCTFCHGAQTPAWTAAELAKAAPPEGVDGEIGTTDRAVGAHAVHLAGGSIGPAVACAECHTVPPDLAHLDGTAAVAFGPAARRGGASPVWNTGTLGCSATYCHGGTLDAGGSNTAPTWTGGPAQAACGTCHAAPPPPPHSTSTNCGNCHTGYTQTTVDAATHLDGVVQGSGHPAGYAAPGVHGPDATAAIVSCQACHGTDYSGGTSGTSCTDCHGGAGFADWRTNCTFCHGTQTPAWTAAELAKAAPPEGVDGETAPTDPRVGAHQRHLTGGTYSNPFTCGTCHAVPADLSHLDGATAVTPAGDGQRSLPASLGTYTPATQTCAVYCHGSTITTPVPAPGWTAAGALACTACHASRPATGSHTSIGAHAGAPCAFCHLGYVQDTSVDLALHVDGGKSVVFPARGGGTTSVTNPGWSPCSVCHTGGATGNANAPVLGLP